MGKLDDAGRAIAGLLTYNPGPGIYSRLERAVEALPENVRVQELPGLLKRYKDGVPGWELKETDLDSVVAGRDVVPRSELLAQVKERSPVYTHREVVLGGKPPIGRVPTGGTASYYDAATDTSVRLPDPTRPEPVYQRSASPIGDGVSHGDPRYQNYGQGGKDYTELLLGQPVAPGEYHSHWGSGMWSTGPEARNYARNNIVAHARFDTHGDALRINELQSDLGIHNRKVREAIASHKGPPAQLSSETDAEYLDVVQQQGYVMQRGDDGEWQWAHDPKKHGLAFPLEDAWADILIKRLALEAARKGHRAIEVASPASVFAKTGNHGDAAESLARMEHFYGKVVPGAIERLGRKMGGLTPDHPESMAVVQPDKTPQYDTHQQLRDQFREATGDEQPGPNFWRLYSGMRYDSLSPAEQAATYDRFGGSHPVSQVEGGLPQEMYDYLHSLGLSPEAAQRTTSQAMYLAPHNARAMHNFAQQEQLDSLNSLIRPDASEAGRRYIMSDEMRKRILTQGIGASLLAPLLAPAGDE